MHFFLFYVDTNHFFVMIEIITGKSKFCKAFSELEIIPQFLQLPVETNNIKLEIKTISFMLQG